jgi:hypothetical protein
MNRITTTYWTHQTAVWLTHQERQMDSVANCLDFAKWAFCRGAKVGNAALNGCVHNQQSRVESNPVQPDSQSRGSDSVAYSQWPPRPCVHNSRVESSSVPRVLPSQESWCRVLYFRQSDSSDRAWRLLPWGINGCGKAYSFSEGPRDNLRRLALWTLEPRLTLMMMFITTKTTAPLTTVVTILLLLGLLFKVKVQSNPKTQMISQWQDTWNRFSFSDSQKCKDKWHKLRSNYVWERRKSKKKISGSGATVKGKWPYYVVMNFLEY